MASLATTEKKTDEAVDEQYSLGADFGGTTEKIFFHTLVSRQRTDDHSLFLSSSFFFFFFFCHLSPISFPLFSPIVRAVKVELEEVNVQKDEDVANVLYSHRSKLYHFIKEDNYGGEVRTNYWKERGLGDIKIMQDKSTSLCRVIMRQEKTLKPVANFMLSEEVALTPSASLSLVFLSFFLFFSISFLSFFFHFSFIFFLTSSLLLVCSFSPRLFRHVCKIVGVQLP